METELLLNFTKEQIQAEFQLKIFSYLKTQVKFSSSYGLSLKDTTFEATVIIESNLQELVQNASKWLRKKLEYARKRIEDAKIGVKEAKESCIKKAAQTCSLCQRITHTEIQVECRKAMDQFEHFIGSIVDKFGECIKRISRYF